MTQLELLENYSEIQFDKTYLMVQVDDTCISSPYIETGDAIIKHLIKKLSEIFDSVDEVLEELGIELEELQHYQFIEFIEGMSEYLDSIEGELDEMGYSIYEI